jgi:hypothetical protein
MFIFKVKSLDDFERLYGVFLFLVVDNFRFQLFQSGISEIAKNG